MALSDMRGRGRGWTTLGFQKGNGVCYSKNEPEMLGIWLAYSTCWAVIEYRAKEKRGITPDASIHRLAHHSIAAFEVSIVGIITSDGFAIETR